MILPFVIETMKSPFYKDPISAILEDPFQMNPLKCGRTTRSVKTLARVFLYGSIVGLLFYIWGYEQGLRALMLGAGGLVIIYIYSMLFEGEPVKEPFKAKEGVDEVAMDALAEKFRELHKLVEGKEGKVAKKTDEDASVVESFISMPESYVANLGGGVGVNERLYGDVTDLFGKTQSQRQFVSVPTEEGVPGDTVALARWLYKDATNCKDRNSECYRGY